ncbi:hypothetical protein CRUP_014155 [Coryphaenoides rupestris]|nr:hypothetical protein CRUP_014155 [Coryphaenoides rupestris]
MTTVTLEKPGSEPGSGSGAVSNGPVPAGLSLVVGLVLYISSINDEVMNRPRESEHFFHYRYGWSFTCAAASFLLKEAAGVMSVYLFMKRYAEEELYRPHPALYRPRLSDCSDYSRQYLHPDGWGPASSARGPRPRSASSEGSSSDISIQLNRSSPPTSSSAPHPPASSSSSSAYPPHPLHPASTGQHRSPLAQPPPFPRHRATTTPRPPHTTTTPTCA